MSTDLVKEYASKIGCTAFNCQRIRLVATNTNNHKLLDYLQIKLETKNHHHSIGARFLTNIENRIPKWEKSKVRLNEFTAAFYILKRSIQAH